MTIIFGWVILRADTLVSAKKELEEHYNSRIDSLNKGIDFLKRQNEELRMMLLRVGVDMTIDNKEERMADFINRTTNKHSASIKEGRI